jgi:predicted lipoprotein with Yx(FWY)xxD motif
MRLHKLGVVVFVAAGLTLAACGGGDGSGSAAATATRQGPASPPTTAVPSAPIATRDSDLGTVLVDATGRTLYGFTDDADGTSTCDGACAVAWPPELVGSASVPAGLDAAIFTVIPRSGGRFQLKAGRWPLYRFAGDSAPGDTNGQGSGGTWFAAAPDGSLIKT